MLTLNPKHKPNPRSWHYNSEGGLGSVSTEGKQRDGDQGFRALVRAHGIRVEVNTAAALLGSKEHHVRISKALSRK